MRLGQEDGSRAPRQVSDDPTGEERSGAIKSGETTGAFAREFAAVHQMIDMIAPGKCESEDHSEVPIGRDDRQKVALEVHCASESMTGRTENDDRCLLWSNAEGEAPLLTPMTDCIQSCLQICRGFLENDQIVSI